MDLFFRYSDGSCLGKAASPLELTFATRTGIDLNPTDLADEDQALWSRTLIWPDQTDRIDRFQKGVPVLRENPPTLTKGSALEELTPFIAGIPNGSTVCVLHSFTLDQCSEEERAGFEAILDNGSIDHDIWWVSLEWLGTEDPELMLERFVCGNKQGLHKLTSCHQHGTWIRLAGKCRSFS